MRIKKNGAGLNNIRLSSIFLAAAIFFAFFSFFGVYRYTVYSWPWFLTFFLYELLFYLGLRSGRFVFGKSYRVKNGKYSFEVSQSGATILWITCLLSILSFAYFVFLYRNTLGRFIFGNYTANSFEEGRTALEKATLLLMQIGGDASFLVLSLDQTGKHRQLKRLSHVTLFLPGIRYMLMGARYSIAAEFLVLLVIKWPQIKERLRFSSRARREKRIVALFAIVLGISFLYLFASRSIYYTALERKAFVSGDMVMKPFWRSLYGITNGRIDFLCTASDYLGEAPYIFAYYCKNRLPEEVFFGQLTFRSIIQIINNLTGWGYGFSELSSRIAGGQYSGIGYILIADFGLVGSFFAAFLFGRVFAVIEKKRFVNRGCAVVFPAVCVICFFAPIFYFYVGRLDYAILFGLILSVLCLEKRRVDDEG